MSYDLIVVGGGPGGYVAAIRAAQLDKDVLVIDDLDNLGGICLNWGCIPTKALLHHAEQLEYINGADKYGINVSDVEVDWEQLIRSSRTPVKKLSKGISSLFSKHGIEHVQDHARIESPDTVTTEDGEQFESENILIATGAKPRTFPGIEPNEDRIFTSKEAMMLKERPESLIILGAGAIGVEFAYFYHQFGTDVTILEMEDYLLPQEDDEISEELTSIFKREGYNVQTGTAVEHVQQEDQSVQVETKDGELLEAKSALIALGLEPNTDGLLNEDMELRSDDAGWIQVKDGYRTSIPGIYAIGDVIGAPWLAHVASHEGTHAVESMFGEREDDRIDPTSIPACTYCQPQVASLGLTEKEANKEYQQVKIGRFPFQAIGRAVAVDEQEGFVKLVFAGDFDELVGAHLIGRNATELISELGLAKKLEATPHEIAETIHPHPTLSEAVMEASLDALDRPIHK